MSSPILVFDSSKDMECFPKLVLLTVARQVVTPMINFICMDSAWSLMPQIGLLSIVLLSLPVPHSGVEVLLGATQVVVKPTVELSLVVRTGFTSAGASEFRILHPYRGNLRQ